MIDKGDIRNLLGYFAFVSDLEDSFGKHVDVVTTTCNEIVWDTLKNNIPDLQDKCEKILDEDLIG